MPFCGILITHAICLQLAVSHVKQSQQPTLLCGADLSSPHNYFVQPAQLPLNIALLRQAL